MATKPNTSAARRPSAGLARETLPASAELPLRRTSFVGRTAELALVERRLSDSAVVTLTGAAGAGKTRLALEAARQSEGRSVRFVDLAALRFAERVPAAIAAAVDARESREADLIDAIVAAVKRRSLLLVLDNCEHLLDAAAGIAAALVMRCPALVILATSRMPLRISGEAVIPVQPLSIAAEATMLFCDRARMVTAGFELNVDNAEAVSEICRRLDGLPLAIELAAAWTAIMSPVELVPLLSSRFDVLIGGARDADGRQRTLRAAVDWSYDLLSDEAKTLFRRLSVFRGSFTRDAAAAVYGDGPPDRVLPALSALCETSMVVVETNTSGASRYRLLETLRDYGRDRLREDANEERAARDRHLAYLAELAERTFDERMRGGALSVVDVLEQYRADVRIALEWAAATDPDLQLRLAGTLAEDFRRSLFNFAEARRVVDDALALSPRASPQRARALVAAGYMALVTEDESAARRLVAEACDLYQRSGDRGGEAWAHLALGHVAWMENDLTTSRQHLLRSRTMYSEEGNTFGANRALLRLGIAESLVEDVTPDAVGHLTAAARTSDALGDPFGAGLARTALRWALMKQGRPTEARAALHQAVRILSSVNEPMVFFAMETLAVHHVGDVREAVRLFGYTRTLRQQHGLRPLRGPLVMNLEESALEVRARSTFGDEGAARADEEGRAMAPEDAIALALGQRSGAAPAPGRHARRGELTPREREITALVAAGRPYREIATQLFLSVRTVEKHVDNVLTTLGLRSRAQLAAWFHEQETAAKDT